MLAKTMGWTYSYIEDELDVQDYLDTLEILDAVEKGQAHLQQRARWRAQSRGGR